MRKTQENSDKVAGKEADDNENTTTTPVFCEDNLSLQKYRYLEQTRYRSGLC